MWWRQAQKQFNQDSRAGNKRKFKQLVARGTVPGIIPYSGSDPVGWCAVQPREEFVRLEESRILAPVDERPIWSVTCLFVAKESRGDGVSTALLKAAAKHVKKSGGRIVEGYPVEPSGRQPAAWLFTGIASAYVKAGFTEVARRSPTRPIMRFHLAK